MEGARCMLEDAKLDQQFWGFAVATAAHIHNRLPSRSHNDKSTLEPWSGEIPTLDYLRVFGSVAYTLVPTERTRKLDSRSTKCILVGYDENAGRKTYRVYNPVLKRTSSSRDVIIDELGITKEKDNRREGGDEIQLTLPELSEPTEDDSEEDRGIPLDPISPQVTGGGELDPEEFGGDTIVVTPLISGVATTDKEVSRDRLRSSGRQRKGGQNFARAMVANLEEPHTLKEALEREDSTEWREAWVSEVDSLARNNTWRLEPLSRGRQAIGCRWLFKQKEDGC